MCRGDHREDIFRISDDYRAFTSAIGEVHERTGFLVHSYVLMPNHYHLLLETPEPNLVAGMKWLQGTYTQRFNRRHGLHGHLFQGRYKAIPVDGEDGSYFRMVSDYIHLNPVRARLLDVRKPDLHGYPWSSYPVFTGAVKGPPWLVRDRVLASHGLPDEKSGSLRRYAALMTLRMRESCDERETAGAASEWNAVRRGWYLGSDTFRDQLLDRVEVRVRGKKRNSYSSDGLHRHDEREALKLLKQATTELGVALQDLWGLRHTDPLKQAVAWWVKSQSVVSDEWVCAKLEMGSRTNVHRAVRAYRAALDSVRSGHRAKLQLCAD